MKKVGSLLLSVVLLLSLAIHALAFTAQLSAQNLSVNGVTYACEKYNIDGSNYFKLRDLAALLNGTGSQFDVGWDGEKGVVSITTNHAYITPTGTELEAGEDKSATAVISEQTIMIDGVVRTDLTVYNIGGNNFFMLREMGDALGFHVDYDAATNSALVESKDYGASISGGDQENDDVPRAWYQIENGSLYIRTNIDSSNWADGYSGTIRYRFSDGSYSHENNGGNGDFVSFPVFSLPYWDEGTTITQVEYLIYDSNAAWRDFWALFTETGYKKFDEVADVFSDHIVARFVLDTPLTVANANETLSLTSFDVTYDYEKQTEDYLAVMDSPLVDEGQYTVHFTADSGTQNSRMSGIFKSGNILKTTKTIHYFVDGTSSGIVKIDHAVCKAQENGSIVCEKAESNLLRFTFEYE